MSGASENPAGRLSRFGDWSPFRELSVTAPAAGGRPFYAGDAVHARMALVRRAIQQIRDEWDRYPDFMADLRDAMQPGVAAGGGVDLRRRAAELFASDKDWLGAEATDDFTALRLYTSAAGYRQMFSTINRAFREDRLIDEATALRSAVFLVELLSIDLFNYCARNSSAREYRGRIYRGMVVTPQELEQFSAVAAGAVAERYVAIPLGMASASTDRATALVFVDEEARRSPDGQPLLWDIEVANLSAERLDVYRAAFPTSVVSTICAVPIERLSEFPDENEVLLRGPFFQILRLRRADDRVGGKPLHVLEALTLTANRDHPSTMRLAGSEAAAARDLFRTLVTAERCRLCERRAREYAATHDTAAFSRLASDQERETDALLRAVERRRAG